MKMSLYMIAVVALAALVLGCGGKQDGQADTESASYIASQPKQIISGTECAMWRAWAQRTRNHVLASEAGMAYSASSPWGPIEISHPDSLDAVIERMRPEGCDTAPLTDVGQRRYATRY